VTASDVTVPTAAVMALVPRVRPVARPLEPDALLTVAIACAAELQFAAVVRVCVVPSVYVPVAVSCRVLCCVVTLLRMMGLVGVMAMDTSVAGVTVKVVVPDTPLRAAVMVLEPTLSPFASPVAAPTEATVGALEVHAAMPVMSWVVASV
jgi:hypothetical protein